MTTIVTRHQCDICKRTYDTLSDALTCEAQGRPTPDEAPIGLVFGYSGGHTYAVAKFYTWKDNPHNATIPLWGCRDTSAGDNLGRELCGDDTLYGRGYLKTLLTRYAKPDYQHPTFKRMVKHLKAKCIPVTVWNGKEVVTLREYLRVERSKGNKKAMKPSKTRGYYFDPNKQRMVRLKVGKAVEKGKKRGKAG